MTGPGSEDGGGFGGSRWAHETHTALSLPSPPALTLATPFDSIYLGLWGFNSTLASIAIGGMFYVLTWQTHLLAIACGRYHQRIPFPLGHACIYPHRDSTLWKFCSSSKDKWEDLFAL